MQSFEYESAEVCVMKGDYPDGQKGPEENRSSPSEPNTLDVVRGRFIDIKNDNVDKETSSYQKDWGGEYHGVDNRFVVPNIVEFLLWLAVQGPVNNTDSIINQYVVITFIVKFLLRLSVQGRQKWRGTLGTVPFIHC